MLAEYHESPVMMYGARLKKLRERLGLTQDKMAQRLGVERPYYWQLEHDKVSPGRKLVIDIELLEKTPDAVIAASRPPTSKPPARGDIMRDVQMVPAQYLPVLSFAQMGALTSYDEIPKDWQEVLPTGRVPDPKAFIVELKGDSMKPRYDDGDKAILLPSSQPRQGGPVVARLRDGETVCKFYSRIGDEITFTSANKRYKPIKVDASDVAWIYPIYQVIKIVWK